MDLRQHRHAEGQLQAHGLLVRLGPHRGGVRPRVLPLGPVDLPAVLEARFGRAPQQPGELVPELRDGARERAGHRGRVLALPRRGGEARPHAVVLQDHRLRPGAAGRPRPAGRLARARQADAGELDRPLRRRRNRLRAVRARRRGSGRADGRRRDHRVHHASRHLVRLLVLPAGARVQGSYGAGGGHRVRSRRARGGGRRRQGERRRARPGRPREARRVHRPLYGEPGERREGARVGGRLHRERLRHRCGHGRAVRRPARLRVRAQVRPAHHSHHPGRGRSAVSRAQRRAGAPRDVGRLGSGLRCRRRAGAVRQVHRHGGRQAFARRRCDHRRPRGRGQGQEDRAVPPARLADQPSALLGQPHPGRALPGMRPRARAGGGPSGAPARGHRPGRRRDACHARGVREHDVPGMRRPGEARDGHDGHVHMLQLVLPALHRSAQRGAAVRAREGEPLDARRPVHRRHRACHPAPAVQPLLHESAARPGAA